MTKFHAHEFLCKFSHLIEPPELLITSSVATIAGFSFSSKPWKRWSEPELGLSKARAFLGIGFDLLRLKCNVEETYYSVCKPALNFG